MRSKGLSLRSDSLSRRGRGQDARAMSLHGLPTTLWRTDGRLDDVSGWCLHRDARHPKLYASSEHGRRYFCPDCGTGLFYKNDHMPPGIIDIQSATYDDPSLVPARVHIQIADRIPWMANAHELPMFDRYPPRK